MRPQHVDLPPHAAPPIVVRAGERPVAVHGVGQHATWLEPGQGVRRLTTPPGAPAPGTEWRER